MHIIGISEEEKEKEEEKRERERSGRKLSKNNESYQTTDMKLR